MNTNTKHFAVLLCFVAVSILTGCATIGGEPTYSRTLPPEARIVSSDKVTTEVVAGVGVTLANYERERFAEEIQAAIRGHAPEKPGSKRSYAVVVQLTKYEKGSAFARAMLAGLGQMHIEATVSIYSMPERKLVGQFTMEKTFSWGGIYGASTTIETVEEEFAKSLAETACAPNPKR
jgi:hypothetical protein